MDGINFFISAQGSKYVKNIGISGSRIYHVTTLPWVRIPLKSRNFFIRLICNHVFILTNSVDVSPDKLPFLHPFIC